MDNSKNPYISFNKKYVFLLSGLQILFKIKNFNL